MIAMKIMAEFNDKNYEVTLKSNSSAEELLKKMKINSETVLISKNREILSEKEKLKDKDKIKILKIISGG